MKIFARWRLELQRVICRWRGHRWSVWIPYRTFGTDFWERETGLERLCNRCWESQYKGVEWTIAEQPRSARDPWADQ